MYYDYTQKIDKIRKRIDDELKRHEQTIEHLLLSASFKRFLPALPTNQYTEFVRNVLINQGLAWEEQTDVDTLENCTIISETEIDQSPKIYCSFHMSSYRLCMLYLLTKNIPLMLLASNDIIKKQGDFIHDSCDKISNSFTHQIIDANAPNSLIKMMREVKKGNSLFVYVDGNAGVENLKTKEKLLDVPILDSYIKVRTGIGFLSKLLNVPLVPIIATRDDGQYPKIHIHKHIAPLPNEGKTEYVERSIKKVYSLLNHELKQYPEQWEAWMYLYKFATKYQAKPLELNFENSHREIKWKFNNRRFLLWLHKNKHYLLDNTDFSMIEISDSIVEFLSGLNEKKKMPLSDSVLLYLIKNQIIL